MLEDILKAEVILIFVKYFRNKNYTLIFVLHSELVFEFNIR